MRLRRVMATAVLAWLMSAVVYATLPATDNFNRADGGLGANWTTVSDDAVISSNQFLANNNVTEGGYWDADSPANDQYVQVVVKQVAVDARWVAVGCRGSADAPSNFDHYIAWTDGTAGSGHTYMEDVADATGTEIATYAGTVAADSVFKMTCIGTAIKVFDDGVEIMSATDATLSSGNTRAFGYGDATGAKLDDFETGNVVAVTGHIFRLLRGCC